MPASTSAMSKLTRPIRLLLLVSVALLALSTAPATSAQEYPVQTGTMTIEEDTGETAGEGDSPRLKDTGVFVGQELRIVGGGFEPGSEVKITIESEPILVITTIADANGEIDVTFVLPEDVPVGDHTLKASGDSAQGGRLVLEQPVEVKTEEAVRSGVASATASAPATTSGSSSGQQNILLYTAVGLALGAVLVKLGWSRSKRNSAIPDPA